MITQLGNKSAVDQIRRRFDKDVERFSNLDTGKEAMMDAPIMLQLAAKAALSASPRAKRLIDIGCGAGNCALKFLPSRPDNEGKPI